MIMPFFTVLSVVCLIATLLIISRSFGSKLFLVTSLGVILKLSVGLINSIYGPLPGADVDALAFEQTAILLAQSWHQGGISFLEFTHRYAYSNFLALLFFVDGNSLLLVPLVNTMITTFAAYNVYKTAIVLRIPKDKIAIIALFLSLNPIILLYSAVPMREAPIYALLTYFFRVLVSQKRHPITLINPSLHIVIACCAYLHIGLLSLYFVLLFYSLDLRVEFKKIFRLRNLLLVLMLANVDFAITWISDLIDIPRLSQLIDSDDETITFDQVKEVQEFKSRGEGAYTYPDIATGSSVIDIGLTAVYMTLRLIFSPFLWEIHSFNLATLVKLLDIITTATLHIFAIRGIARGDKHSYGGFLYASYFFLSLIFGMNTVNDGVALRHRTKFVWILVLAAISGMSREPKK